MSVLDGHIPTLALLGASVRDAVDKTFTEC